MVLSDGIPFVSPTWWTALHPFFWPVALPIACILLMVVTFALGSWMLEMGSSPPEADTKRARKKYHPRTGAAARLEGQMKPKSSSKQQSSSDRSELMSWEAVNQQLQHEKRFENSSTGAGRTKND
mmetsp:Transcript_71/g.123  ORF Transcript_71/g.123 Transcript_71/m.123 type:complete len:125 (-) Transcript_71:617-991(-)